MYVQEVYLDYFVNFGRFSRTAKSNDTLTCILFYPLLFRQMSNSKHILTTLSHFDCNAVKSSKKVNYNLLDEIQ